MMVSSVNQGETVLVTISTLAEESSSASSSAARDVGSNLNSFSWLVAKTSTGAVFTSPCPLVEAIIWAKDGFPLEITAVSSLKLTRRCKRSERGWREALPVPARADDATLAESLELRASAAGVGLMSRVMVEAV